MFFVFNLVLFSNLFFSNVFCLKSSSPTSTPSTKSIIWPSEFSQQFITPNGQFQSSGTLYFSEALKTTRIDHSPGSFECFKFYNTTQGCSLIMNEKGLHRILDNQNCCLDMPNIKSTNRDWMINATFVGEKIISGRNCFHWTNIHDYYTNVEGDPRIPCLFTFPPAPQQNMIFLYYSFDLSKIPKAIFELPKNCNKRC
mmetsp:Transcript_473/g.605  ORF Transcript_473/g.605 Transcript_473/m.605 type:complete len:198 (+) Transcript_473:30-623(+)